MSLTLYVKISVIKYMLSSISDIVVESSVFVRKRKFGEMNITMLEGIFN